MATDAHSPDHDAGDSELTSNESGYFLEFEEPDTRTLRLRILGELQEIRFRAGVLVFFLIAVTVALVIGLIVGFD